MMSYEEFCDANGYDYGSPVAILDYLAYLAGF